MGEMSHVKTRNLPHIGQICSQYAGGHEKGVMGESSRFTHNPLLVEKPQGQLLCLLFFRLFLPPSS